MSVRRILGVLGLEFRLGGGECDEHYSHQRGLMWPAQSIGVCSAHLEQYDERLIRQRRRLIAVHMYVYTIIYIQYMLSHRHM